MTNQQGAPEALRLAGILDGSFSGQLTFYQVANELRRLAALVEAQQPAPLCTRSHPHEQMTWRCQVLSVVAELRNMEARGQEATEHELGRFADRLDVALQPAPSAAAVDECRRCVGTGRIDTGKGALGHEVYADCPDCQPSPTPQADSAPLAAPADIVVLEAALRAIHQAIDLIGEPDTERLRTVRRVLRGAVVVAEDSTAPQADSQPAAQQKAPADELEEVLRERDDAEDFINELLDEVLGADRPEWSSAYNRYDAMNDVRERITALHKPAVDKAWGRFESAMAAPQPSPTPQADSQPAPIDMVLHCPKCGMQHIDVAEVGPKVGSHHCTRASPDGCEECDAAEEAHREWLSEGPWLNPPHRSHLCHGCGHIWRPADVPTNGVKSVKTTGKADSVHAPVLLSDEELCQIEEPYLLNFRIPLGGQYDFARAVEKAVLAKTYGTQAPNPTPPAQAADSVLEDAARWNEVLMHVGAAYHLGGQHFTLNTLRIRDQMYLLRGSVAQHFTTCIDDSRAARKQGGA